MRDRRFVDIAASSFTPRNHYRTSIVLFLSYLLFFLFAIVTILITDNNIIITINVLILFMSLSCIGNFLYIKKVNIINNIVETQSTILSSILNDTVDAFIVLGRDRSVFYRSHSLCSASHGENDLDNICLFSSANESERAMISDLIYSDEAFSDKGHKLLQLESGATIASFPIPKLYGFRYIRISKSYSASLISGVDQLPLGFAVFDTHGYISDVNNYLTRLLGYEKAELMRSGMRLENLVNIELTKLKDWAGVSNIKDKFGNSISLFTVLRPFSKGCAILYAIKLPDKQNFYTETTLDDYIDFAWENYFENFQLPIAFMDSAYEFYRTNNVFNEILKDAHEITDIKHILDANAYEVFTDGMDKLKSDSEMLIRISDIMINDRNYCMHLSKLGDNSKTYFVITLFDMTEHKLLEENFSHAQRMQTVGYLAGSIAHDFNNVLTAISGFCDLLLLRHTATDPSFGDIMQIKQSGNKAANMVRRLMAFSRKQQLKLEVVNMGSLINDIFSIIKRLVGSDVMVERDICDNIWPVRVDSVQMEQVIMNLAVNAHQAIDGNGRIDITATNKEITNVGKDLPGFSSPPGETMIPNGKYVLISIKDNGLGIPKDKINKIFEPFFTTKQHNSTGLGLSTAYGIIRQCNGYIYVHSEARSGTEFRIFLKKVSLSSKEKKIYNDPLLNIKQKQISTHNYVITNSVNILLVEDEDGVRSFARGVLQSKGYNVHDFASGKEAFTALEKDHKISPSILITDVIMPGLNGPALAKQVRKLYPNIKVIFMSGYSEDAIEKEFIEEEGVTMLAKPFSLDELIEEVKKLLV